jgi:hypothetical protein
VQARKTSKDFKTLQEKTLLALKNKADEEVAVELKHVVVVDPNQGLDTEGLEQEEKKAEDKKGFFSWKYFSIIVGGGFNSGGEG